MGTGMGMDEREALAAIEHVRDVLQGASALIARGVIGDDNTGTVVETIGYAIDRAWRDLDDALYAFDRAEARRGDAGREDAEA